MFSGELRTGTTIVPRASQLRDIRTRRARRPRVEPLRARVLMAHLTILAPAAVAAVATAGAQVDSHSIPLGNSPLTGGSPLAVSHSALAGLVQALANVGSTIQPTEDILNFQGSTGSQGLATASQASSVDFGLASGPAAGDLGGMVGIAIDADPGESPGQPIDIVLKFTADDLVSHAPPGLTNPHTDGSNHYDVTYTEQAGGPVLSLGSGTVQGPVDVIRSVTIHSAIGSRVSLGFRGTASTGAAAANSEILGGLVVTIDAALQQAAPAPAPAPPHPTGVSATGHSRKGLTSITLAFDEALAPTSATNPALYSVLGGARKRGKTVYSRVVPSPLLHQNCS